MNELLYKEEVFQLVGVCMEIHRELGKATTKSSTRMLWSLNSVALGFHFCGRKITKSPTREFILPHYYYADFVVWDKILFEAKGVEKLTDSHIKQVLNYLAASKLRLALLVNFGGDSLEWKRVIL
jgi:GxxExxY protein